MPSLASKAHESAVERLLQSEKFHRWQRDGDYEIPSGTSPRINLPIATEKHFSPAELAEAWGVSVETIRAIFRDEVGVLKLGKTGTKYRRGYVTLRIPEEVAERVHRKLSA